MRQFSPLFQSALAALPLEHQLHLVRVYQDGVPLAKLAEEQRVTMQQMQERNGSLLTAWTSAARAIVRNGTCPAVPAQRGTHPVIPEQRKR